MATKEEIKAFKKTATLEYIRDYCKQDEARKAWYNAKVKEKYPVAVFPKGNDGKIDKSQAPETQMRPITFIMLQAAFIKEFFPQYAPDTKPEKETMYTAL